MVFFCPHCWSRISENEKICPDCKAEIMAFDQRSYFEKLAGALHHPVATTRMRAAYVLGEIGDKRGIKLLADLIDQAWETQSLFFLREIAIALGKIDGDEAVPALVHLLDHPSFLIREAALTAMPKGKSKSAAAAVRKALEDPSSRVRVRALEYLKKNSEG